MCLVPLRVEIGGSLVMVEKIESVLTYREEGRKIEIINEELWNALTVCDEQ